MLRLYFEFSRQLASFDFIVRQELVQRRIERADRYRQPVHRFEYSLEVFALKLEQACEPTFVHSPRLFDFLFPRSAGAA